VIEQTREEWLAEVKQLAGPALFDGYPPEMLVKDFADGLTPSETFREILDEARNKIDELYDEDRRA
jgi:hypothetical protein